ncbi:MAG: hypothetical protein RR657_05555 [Peptostreptococcaceae bacterium]
MKNNIKKIIYMLIAIIQICIIGGSFILQYLTNTKAGVMHHVYFKRYQFESGIFSSGNLQRISNIIFIISLIFILLEIYTIVKKKNLNFIKVQNVIGLILSLILYFVIKSKYFIDMIAYPYFIIAFSVVLIIQICVVILGYIVSLKKN